ncbi:MAG TPA: DUF664 domain-containing protein, partial [Acidimicrobiales bacterium]
MTDDALWFVTRALDDMVGILEELGDTGANRRPDIADANSAYAIATHCLGVLEFWGGFMIAGRVIERDRAAEFEATGLVADLVARIETAKVQLASDVEGMDPSAAVPDIGPNERERPYRQRQGAVVLHLLEELYQHLGQMELGRDVLSASPLGDEGDVDIACTLGAEAWIERIEEWQELARSAVGARELSARQLRFRLRSDDAVAA